MKPEITRTGKIARLSADLRTELCERLLDGQRGPRILTWLNAHPAVKKLVKSQYKNEPVSAENLSNWRRGGFVDWRARRDRLDHLKEMSTHMGRMARAGGGRMSEGAAATAAGLISETLEAAAQRMMENPGAEQDHEKITELVRALTQLRQAEVAQQRADQDAEKLKRLDEQIALERAKFQHAVRAGLQKFLEDEATRAIIAGHGGQDEKIEALGVAMFGDLWK